MTDAIRVEGPVGRPDSIISFETGELARLADGAVVAQHGDTVLLATAVASRSVREGIDFFPLTIDVEERMYAVGKIPGSFFRREGRPGEQAVLACRLVDRPLRPCFPDGFRNEVQVIATVLGADQENPHDVLAINAASAALMISGIPFSGPVGAVRLAHHDGEWLANPTFQEGDESTFELVVAGRRDDAGEISIMMVEAGGTEATWDRYQEGAPKVTEEVITGGLELAKVAIGASIDLQLELRAAVEKVNGPIETIPFDLFVDYDDDVFEAVHTAASAGVTEALAVADKAQREDRLAALKVELVGNLVGNETAPGPFADRAAQVGRAYRSLQKKITRRRIVEEGARIDGRGPTEIRPLSAKVGVIRTAHGSAVFERGETQVLNITTLGMPRMAQMLDTIGIDDSKRYMHHYNFPPFSTGETGRVGSPRRREIGHGALAERALLPVVPSSEEFPYTLRLVSDVLSSNGSTSMASVCGSTLSLMDAGVPIKAPVAGIAMGLVADGGAFTTLTDILGAEDAFGDMDFKVAGTAEFVTALQLDTKIEGLPAEVLGQALRQAYDARMTILGVITAAIAEPRGTVAATAPKIISFDIPIDRVGEVIGPKGKVINTIQQETGADISVDDDGVVGTVTIGAKEGEKVEDARQRIELILNPPTAEVGANYTGKVVNITKFGAFVNILPGRDGLLHISKIGRGKRVDRVEDVFALGDEVEVRVDDVDPNGKVSLSLAGDAPEGDGDGAGDESRARPPRAEMPPVDVEASGASRGAATASGSGSGRAEVSFEASFNESLVETYGDLGPSGEQERKSSDRGDRGRGGRGGGGRGPSRR